MYAGMRIIPGTNRSHTALVLNREGLARDPGMGAPCQKTANEKSARL
jgi:hypothetical protein